MTDSKDNILAKFVDILKNVRVWILLVFLLFTVIAVNYTFNNDGVVINGVTPGSIAEKSGISYDSKVNLRNLEEIYAIDGNQINSVEEFYNYFDGVDENTTVIITTNRNPEGYELVYSGNRSVSENLGLSLREEPASNIKLGIELEGGSRIILKVLNSNISEGDYELLVNTLQNRLDVYGASGTKVNKLEDAFSTDRFVIVESISSNKNDIFALIQRQGEFEAYFNNKTIFTGENILRVFNDPGNVMFTGCNELDGGYQCGYSFSIEIDSQASEAFYNEARDMKVIGGQLVEEISFILDGNEITSLSVSDAFKSQRITNPQITIAGSVLPTEELAIESVKKELAFLQAILSTKSLPSELEVVQSYSISSSMGESLLNNALKVGIAALLLVSAVVALRYRKIGIFVGIFIALIGEVIIVMGIAAFMRLSIDLAAIGGLIAAIGTGVDDQIIITDEYFRKKNKQLASRKKIKNAMYIVMIAYFTTLAAMVPLYFAGLKVLQGFAFMIIVGITVGVLITRPAYAAMLRIMMTSRAQREEEKKQEEEEK